MFETWYDGPSGDQSHLNSSLGQEYLINDAGDVSPVHGASGGSGGKSSSSTNPSSSPPAPTLVGSSGGFQIDLIWDASVTTAPGGFVQAIIDAAQYYTTLFSNKVVVNIEVGWGEIAGSTLASNALGESESYGYVGNYYSLVTGALKHDGYAFTASNEPTNSQFWINTAEAKALGLVSGSTIGTSSLDGYIGFSTLSGTGYSWNFTGSVSGSNSGTASNQFDFEAVAQHEISEVMGRIEMQGALVNGVKTYTPLDLFNFSSAGHLELSGNGGYFSTNDGTTHLGTFNNASAYGGDIADWASYSSISQSGTLAGLPQGNEDAYDAFAWPGDNGGVSQDDILVDAALGYTLTPAGVKAA
jgi:hypothetical protein